VTEVTKMTASITNHRTFDPAAKHGGFGSRSIRVRKDMEVCERKIAEQPFCLREMRGGLAWESDDEIGTD
jgi:hypothetical protein